MMNLFSILQNLDYIDKQNLKTDVEFIERLFNMVSNGKVNIGF